MNLFRPFLIAAFAISTSVFASPAGLAPADLVFAEQGGLVAVEAEHFFKQDLTAKRAWQVVTPTNRPKVAPDTDGTHIVGASGGAYIEVLPDTRWTHGEKLVVGENISHEPGKLAVLSYKVHFSTPGRYHFWARAYSTGTEDNGLHVGIDGTWPESGQRWQTTQKNGWKWDSRQRTNEVHVGVPGQLFLDVSQPGEHVIQISMREDGLEIDKWVMTTDRAYTPTEQGPATRVKAGRVPEAFAIPANYKEDPAPTTYTPDPSAKKKAKKAAAPAAAKPASPAAPSAVPHVSAAAAPAVRSSASAETTTVLASSLNLQDTGFYLDKGKWAAINPNQRKEASVKFTAPASNGRYRITLHAVGENDGNSSYDVLLGERLLGTFTCPPSKEMFEEGPRFTQTWENIPVNEGEGIEVRARIGSNDGREYSRARWSKLEFTATELDPGRSGVRSVPAASQPVSAAAVPRLPDGNGSVRVSGELKQWHKVTLDLAGPFAAETDTAPNPFTDYALNVTFTHSSGQPSYVVPGYFAADGRAAETSATSGTVWRAHLSPDKPGTWTYRVSFASGPSVATAGGGRPLTPFDGASGSFTVAPTDKAGRDFRAAGRLQKSGQYLRHAGSGAHFLKVGADAPETLLATVDFDGTLALKPNVPLKTWAPHEQDWRAGDPTWKDGKGKGLIGALNYLSAKGANAFSFLTYNAAGDGDNIWPFVSRDQKFHYDCSKLDQWGIVFDHATKLGLFLHFKLQENENDDHRFGPARTPKVIQEALDGGATGPERKLYLREIIARFGHALALNWNLGEENTQSTEEQVAMADYIAATDPYRHLIVVHTFPPQQDRVYDALLAIKTPITGISAQNSWSAAHARTVKWVRESRRLGQPWVVNQDEQNPARLGVPPDPGYKGFAGAGKDGKPIGYDLHDIRQATLWGTFLAGGAGVEYYFGYELAENDLVCEDFRSRDRSWDYARIALEFFAREKLPLDAMDNADELVGNPEHTNTRYCFAQPGRCYLVYLPKGGSAEIDLGAAPGTFTVGWFNPREGGPLLQAPDVTGGKAATLTAPDASDWLAVLRVKR